MTFIRRANLMNRQVFTKAGAVDGIFPISGTRTGRVQQFHKDDCSFGKGKGVED